MPAFFNRNSSTFERAQWKFDKECFEKYDEAETILHTAIVWKVCHKAPFE
jgi:hypothetical protein